ncbi:hypothetical protein P170DRAFT_204580 [Aspergillus steynii IBT 23096]|uniref:Uncharacterized protein n=1 Tax=Aspergillus steynii IBT 23096 TaxID=1392250 RepID=A0A2I2G5C1_9EURO|nr:uncharacterized protein P170DRAFT_204580 [Aspergillus steynii IBT 23096]PLB48043.1 hypothetical protein P170DRAFT_204580 [Aspergillus steynii IBT 23096]
MRWTKMLESREEEKKKRGCKEGKEKGRGRERERERESRAFPEPQRKKGKRKRKRKSNEADITTSPHVDLRPAWSSSTGDARSHNRSDVWTSQRRQKPIWMGGCRGRCSVQAPKVPRSLPISSPNLLIAINQRCLMRCRWRWTSHSHSTNSINFQAHQANHRRRMADDARRVAIIPADPRSL